MKVGIASLVFATWSGGAIAGLFGDSVTYDIRVVDTHDKPIPAATVWVLAPDVSRPDLRPEDLARQVRHYAPDVDFIFSGSTHPQLWVLRVDPDGKIRFRQEDTEVHGMKRVQASFAGFKRGYLPAQVDDDSSNNARRKIVVRLERDPSASVDPRMETLDRVRAFANSGNDLDEDPMSADRGERLHGANRQLRDLASQLEKDGRTDDAAAIYYNLAFLPSVDFIRNANGQLVASGYTNGYDDNNPQRVADRQRALSLAHGHPMLELEILTRKYAGTSLRNLTIAANAPLRRAYLAEIESMIAQHGERLWPRTYAGLDLMYAADGHYEQGCGAIRRWHELEPSYFDVKGWTHLLAVYLAGPQMKAVHCEIAGIRAPDAH